MRLPRHTLWLIACLCIVVVVESADKADESDQHQPVPRPRSTRLLDGPYFQGDIAASYEQLARRFGRYIAGKAKAKGHTRNIRGSPSAGTSRRLAVSQDESLRWEKVNDVVQVPFLIDGGSFNSGEEQVIRNAMTDIETRTKGLFAFVERSTQADYIMFQRGNTEDDCFSHVGRIGAGEQPISLTDKCLSLGFVQHEILHALGFWHEQSRSDRDAHVTIQDRHIQLGSEDEFTIEATSSGGSPYDYGSVMHFAADTFGQAQQSCTTQDFCLRRGRIRFRSGQTFFCLVPEATPAVGVRVDFFDCDNLPVTGNQWGVIPAENAEGSIIRYEEVPQLCLSMRDQGSGIYEGQLPLVLQLCPQLSSATDLEAKHMFFYFSGTLSGIGALDSTEIRPLGDPFLCLDHTGSILAATICDSTSATASQFQLWEFTGDLVDGCAGIQLSCGYETVAGGEFELKTTIVAPQAIGQRVNASDEDIRQLVVFYTTGAGDFGSRSFDVNVDLPAALIGSSFGFVTLLAIATARLYLKRRSRRRSRRRSLQRRRSSFRLSETMEEPVVVGGKRRKLPKMGKRAGKRLGTSDSVQPVKKLKKSGGSSNGPPPPKPRKAETNTSPGAKQTTSGAKHVSKSSTRSAHPENGFRYGSKLRQPAPIRQGAGQRHRPKSQRVPVQRHQHNTNYASKTPKASAQNHQVRPVAKGTQKPQQKTKPKQAIAVKTTVKATQPSQHPKTGAKPHSPKSNGTAKHGAAATSAKPKSSKRPTKPMNKSTSAKSPHNPGKKTNGSPRNGSKPSTSVAHPAPRKPVKTNKHAGTGTVTGGTKSATKPVHARHVSGKATSAKAKQDTTVQRLGGKTGKPGTKKAVGVSSLAPRRQMPGPEGGSRPVTRGKTQGSGGKVPPHSNA